MRFMIIVRASRATIPYLLERWSGVNGDTARRLGPVLSQSGEFAVVLFAAGAIQGVIGEPIANLLTLAVTLSMAAQSLALFIDKAISRASKRQQRQRYSGNSIVAQRHVASRLSAPLCNLPLRAGTVQGALPVSDNQASSFRCGCIVLLRSPEYRLL